MEWKIEFSRHALKDAKKLKSANLDKNVKQLIEVLKQNPYQPPYEKLTGNLQGYYSRRINIKHRLVYRVEDSSKIVKVVSVWSHAELQTSSRIILIKCAIALCLLWWLS
ncbi:Txe/YoeB family addiction module toxin [Pleurocapsales cyanobacterium LEGE 06147]|nr:Txe/YoeB family addiction module toxin [Pleurocapsales cyanobacterium LEGE 06147]